MTLIDHANTHGPAFPPDVLRLGPDLDCTHSPQPFLPLPFFLSFTLLLPFSLSRSLSLASRWKATAAAAVTQSSNSSAERRRRRSRDSLELDEVSKEGAPDISEEEENVQQQRQEQKKRKRRRGRGLFCCRAVDVAERVNR